MKRGLLLAFVALVAVDLAIFAGVRLDRTSDDVVFVTLDERELRLVHQDDASSAIELRFATQAGGRLGMGSTATSLQSSWIGQETLTHLGFNCDIWPADPRAASHYRAQLARGAYVAFDLGTDVWTARLAEWGARVRAHAAEGREAAAGAASPGAEAEADVEAGAFRSSRLVPIDVARDRGALRGKYRDRPATVILPVVVDIAFVDGSATHERAEVRGWIRDVFPRVIPVPARLRSVFTGLPDPTRPSPRTTTGGLAHPPRYDVTLAFGPALRPWVVDARRIRPARD